MALVDFLSPLHKKTTRDYLARVIEYPKAKAAQIAKRFDEEYWDGDRRHGYGGYTYDGRWRIVAEAMRDYYSLNPGDRVLDVGCGKAYLLYELTQVVSDLEVVGLDISEYALQRTKEGVRQRVCVGSATHLPFPSDSFDLVISMTTLHNLYCDELDLALREMERVGRRHKYLVVESYRNEEEKANLLYWQLTCECFFTPREWEWWFRHAGYRGDHSYIYFE